MKTKLIFSLTILFISALFMACDNGEKHRKDLDELKAYAEEKRDSADKYLDRTWDEIDREFAEMRAEIDKDSAKFSAELKAEYYETVDAWEDYKNEFAVKQEERKKLAEMDALRATLVIGGVRADYTDLAATDVVREYRHFVTVVDSNKDAYTKEQWTVINVNWKALNGRKREVDKDITAKDNNEITKLQLKYTGIKAVNRPFADNP